MSNVVYSAGGSNVGKYRIYDVNVGGVILPLLGAIFNIEGKPYTLESALKEFYTSKRNILDELLKRLAIDIAKAQQHAPLPFIAYLYSEPGILGQPHVLFLAPSLDKILSGARTLPEVYTGFLGYDDKILRLVPISVSEVPVIIYETPHGGYLPVTRSWWEEVVEKLINLEPIEPYSEEELKKHIFLRYWNYFFRELPSGSVEVQETPLRFSRLSVPSLGIVMCGALPAGSSEIYIPLMLKGESIIFPLSIFKFVRRRSWDIRNLANVLNWMRSILFGETWSIPSIEQLPIIIEELKGRAPLLVPLYGETLNMLKNVPEIAQIVRELGESELNRVASLLDYLIRKQLEENWIFYENSLRSFDLDKLEYLENMFSLEELKRNPKLGLEEFLKRVLNLEEEPFIGLLPETWLNKLRRVSLTVPVPEVDEVVGGGIWYYIPNISTENYVPVFITGFVPRAGLCGEPDEQILYLTSCLYSPIVLKPSVLFLRKGENVESVLQALLNTLVSEALSEMS